MHQFEYRAIPAPSRPEKVKGLKTSEERLARSLTELMNQMAADGWDYLRADTLPCEERKGLFGGRELRHHSLLVFRRALPVRNTARNVTHSMARPGQQPALAATPEALAPETATHQAMAPEAVTPEKATPKPAAQPPQPEAAAPRHPAPQPPTEGPQATPVVAPAPQRAPQAIPRQAPQPAPARPAVAPPLSRPLVATPPEEPQPRAPVLRAEKPSPAPGSRRLFGTTGLGNRGLGDER